MEENAVSSDPNPNHLSHVPLEPHRVQVAASQELGEDFFWEFEATSDGLVKIAA